VNGHDAQWMVNLTVALNLATAVIGLVRQLLERKGEYAERR
jgi:hypothetical protein